MNHYHLRIAKDELRKIAPIGIFSAAGITIHHRSATWDRESDSPIYHEGLKQKVSDEQLARFKKALEVDTRPTQVLDKEQDVAIARGDKAVLERIQSFREAPHGRGPVVQWAKVDGGWTSKVLDRSDRSYQPIGPNGESKLLDDDGKIVAEEKAFAHYVKIALVPEDVELPSVNLDHEAEQAARVEREEERDDPEGFAKQKTHNRRAKALGVAPETAS